MASKVSTDYVCAALEILSCKLQNNNIIDFSYENLKKIIDESKILENKIKITSKSKMGGWHAFISENRKHDNMKNLGEKWKLMSEEEKQPYNTKALQMREADKIKKTNTQNKIIFKTKTPPKNSNIVEKPKSLWITFKEIEQSNGNTDIANIKEKYGNLSSDEKEIFKEISLRNFLKNKSEYQKSIINS